MQTQPFKVGFTPTYYQQWDAISTWLKQEVAANVAVRLFEAIQEQLSMVAVMPHMFVMYQHDQDYRKMKIAGWNYVIFYQIVEDEQLIIVHRIYHTAQNYQADLADEGQFWPLFLKS